MRVTVNLDDVLAVVDERTRRERGPAGQVISDLVRQALVGRESTVPEVQFHGSRSMPHRGRPVTHDLIDQLREDEL